MKSFKEYTKQAADVASSQTEQTEEETLNAEELTRKIAAACNGRSNADMLRGILAEAEKSKRAGTLSNEEIEAFYQSFAPMLNALQKRQLRAVVEKLKQI